MFHPKVVEELKTHFMLNNFSPKTVPYHLWDNVGKYVRNTGRRFQTDSCA